MEAIASRLEAILETKQEEKEEWSFIYSLLLGWRQIHDQLCA